MICLLICGDAQRISSPDAWTKSLRSAQYHTQDPVSGAYQYGYSGPHHAKSESSINGITRGGKFVLRLYNAPSVISKQSNF